LDEALAIEVQLQIIEALPSPSFPSLGFVDGGEIST
jgi:hypothetical protein